MNSSGIKKGLAVSAISALAITGVPALATSASAAPSDVLTVQSVSGARNGGTEGAIVVLNASGVNEANLGVAGANGTGSASDGTQTVAIVPGSVVRIPSGQAGDLTPNNGLDQITLRVTVTTPPGGDDVANFVVFEDEPVLNGTPDASEVRVPITLETTGAVTSVDISPATQTSPSGTPSAPYTVTIRDSEGDLTQLTTGEAITLDNGTGDAVFGGEAGDGDVIDPTEITDGTATFTATGTALTSQTITATINGVQDTAVLNTTAAASIQLDDIDVVTGADSSDGEPAQDPTFVRVDQTSVRLDISSNDTGAASDAGGTVTFTVTGNGVTFGGQPTTTVSTTLDANGVGSVVITPDAGTIQAGDSFSVSGSGINGLDIVFARAAITAASVQAPDTVFTKVDTATTVTVTIVDQFGNPAPGAQVSATAAGNGSPATLPRQTANASGQVTFTFPAGDTQVGDQDTITYTVFDDAADATGTPANETTTVNYTADGTGPDFQLTLDGQNTELTTYSPDDVSVFPLTDALADDNNSVQQDEVVEVEILNGAAGVPVTVSVDNGALILDGGNGLEDGVSTLTGETGDVFQIVGTKSGLVTVTTTSAGRTETAQFTVLASGVDAARNVSVSGPATAAATTDQITYTAVVTDAFGNPIADFPLFGLNVQVSGPGRFQDGDAVTNANGQINLNVDVDDDAAGQTITIRVQGLPNFAQFGADADRVDSTDTADADGEGLPASMDVATASTLIDGRIVGPTRTKIDARLAQIETGPRVDKLVVTTTPVGAADGARVNLFRLNKNGTRVLVESAELNLKGKKRFQVADLNGNKNTRYVARIKRTDDSTGVKATNTVKTK